MRPIWRVPIVALAMLSMAWGAWLGLLRLGWVLPLPWPDQLILHGPLMIGGFIGTLVGLERAVGVGRLWPYGAPALTATGSFLLVLGPPGSAGVVLITLGSALVVAIYLSVLRRHPSMSAATMTAAATAWVIGNAQWLSGAAISRVVFWWMAFIVLTIAGERLELSRFLAPSRRVRIAFVIAACTLVAGAALARAWPEVGVRILGVGLMALCGWLAVHDMARRALGQPGLTRFIAVSLLSGYVWLGVGGVLAVAIAPASPGPPYDALLHAIFLGFVVSMIFGHAPIVFPAVAGRPIPFRWTFYLPLIVLHASVGVRVLGDLVEELGRLRSWGGLLNALALLLFIVNTASSVARDRRT